MVKLFAFVGSRIKSGFTEWWYDFANQDAELYPVRMM